MSKLTGLTSKIQVKVPDYEPRDSSCMTGPTIQPEGADAALISIPHSRAMRPHSKLPQVFLPALVWQIDKPE